MTAPQPSGGIPWFWVALPVAGIGFATFLYRSITSSADLATSSMPVWLGDGGSSDAREAALTDATVRLFADLAAGRADSAYGGMSATYRAVVSSDRFAAAVGANPLLRGAHDAVPSHWTIQTGTADVRGAVLDGSGQRTSFAAAFAREASGWKATSLSLGNVPALPQGPP